MRKGPSRALSSSLTEYTVINLAYLGRGRKGAPVRPTYGRPKPAPQQETPLVATFISQEARASVHVMRDHGGGIVCPKKSRDPTISTTTPPPPPAKGPPRNTPPPSTTTPSNACAPGMPRPGPAT